MPLSTSKVCPQDKFAEPWLRGLASLGEGKKEVWDLEVSRTEGAKGFQSDTMSLSPEFSIVSCEVESC